MFILLLLTFGLPCKTAAVNNDKGKGVHLFQKKKSSDILLASIFS